MKYIEILSLAYDQAISKWHKWQTKADTYLAETGTENKFLRQQEHEYDKKTAYLATLIHIELDNDDSPA